MEGSLKVKSARDLGTSATTGMSGTDGNANSNVACSHKSKTSDHEGTEMASQAYTTLICTNAVNKPTMIDRLTSSGGSPQVQPMDRITGLKKRKFYVLVKVKPEKFDTRALRMCQTKERDTFWSNPLKVAS